MQFEGSTRCNFCELIWSSEAPLKCRVFGWLALLGKCHTADCLQKKGWPHNTSCVMWLSEQETVLHLLATCPIAIRLWRKLLTTAGLPTTLAPDAGATSLTEWLSTTRHAQPAHKRKSWVSLVHLTWWSLRKERNTRIFQNTAAPLSGIYACIVDEAKLWREAGRSGAADLLCRPREPD